MVTESNINTLSKDRRNKGLMNGKNIKVNFKWEFRHDHHKPSYNYNEISEL